MPLELRWLASASASCFYAAERLLCSPADPRLSDALAALTTVLGENQVESLLAHVTPLSATVHMPRELAEVALRKTLGPPRQENLVDRVAELLTAMQSAFHAAMPGPSAGTGSLVDELALRAEPLRGQWEARGPGLLAVVARWTDPAFLAERADVVLVHPVAGGGGRANHFYNSVCIEAVLANPLPDLPEVLRLGWLLAQLNAELPMYQGEMRRDRAFEVTALATLPIVLAAGEEVELCRSDAATIRHALEAWQVAGENPEERSAALLQWWQTYAESRPAWSVALAALDRMV